MTVTMTMSGGLTSVDHAAADIERRDLVWT
jgi:hypothetical protein